MADTSAIYALFDVDDARHPQARAAFEHAEPVLIPHEILVESMALLVRRLGFAAAAEAGLQLRGLPHVEVQPTPDDVWDDVQGAAWNSFADSGGVLSHADAIVVAWCRHRRVKPLTFDKALLQAARR